MGLAMLGIALVGQWAEKPMAAFSGQGIRDKRLNDSAPARPANSVWDTPISPSVLAMSATVRTSLVAGGHKTTTIENYVSHDNR
jgi:hypothetical protein